MYAVHLSGAGTGTGSTTSGSRTTTTGGSGTTGGSTTSGDGGGSGPSAFVIVVVVLLGVVAVALLAVYKPWRGRCGRVSGDQEGQPRFTELTSARVLRRNGDNSNGTRADAKVDVGHTGSARAEAARESLVGADALSTQAENGGDDAVSSATAVVPGSRWVESADGEGKTFMRDTVTGTLLPVA